LQEHEFVLGLLFEQIENLSQRLLEVKRNEVQFERASAQFLICYVVEHYEL